MPVALLQPGVYIEELPSGVRTITGVATSITLFVGWAPRGPTNRALRLTSFADYQRAYQALLRATSTAHAPWIIVPANSKTHRNLMIATVVRDTLHQLQLRYPPADPALAGLRIQ